jgi:hypothetical protein
VRECKRSLSNPDPDLKCKEHLVASHTELKKEIEHKCSPSAEALIRKKKKKNNTSQLSLPILMLANYKTNITSNVINFSLKKIQSPYS